MKRLYDITQYRFKLEEEIKSIKDRVKKDKRKLSEKEKEILKLDKKQIKLYNLEIEKLEKEEEENKEEAKISFANQKQAEEENKEKYGYFGDMDLLFVILYEKYGLNFFNIDEVKPYLLYVNSTVLCPTGLYRGMTIYRGLQTCSDVQNKVSRISDNLSSLIEKLISEKILFYDNKTSSFIFNSSAEKFYNQINTKEKYENYIKQNLFKETDTYKIREIEKTQRKNTKKINFIGWATIIGTFFGFFGFLAWLGITPHDLWHSLLIYFYIYY
jgi:hypothetical protein